MPKAFYSIAGVSIEGEGAKVSYSVVVFDTPTPDEFGPDCRLIAGLSGVQTAMLIASKIAQDVIGRGHIVTVADIISLQPIQ